MTTATELEIRRKRTDNTQRSKMDSIKKFREFCEEKAVFGNQTSLEFVLKGITDKKLDIYKILADFCFYMTFYDIAGSSQRTYMAHVKQHVVDATDIDIVSEKYKSRVKPKLAKVQKDRDAELTHELASKIISVMPEKIQLICMLQVSMLRRPGELNLLTPNDFDFTKTPIEVTIPSTISKNNSEGRSFVTAECAKMLQNFIKRHNLKDNDLLFDYATSSGMSKLFQENMKRHLEDMVKPMGKRRYKIHLYSFKKFGFTQVENTPSHIIPNAKAFAKDLKGDLSEYSRLPQTDRAKYYLKCEPRLTIFNQDRLREELEISTVDHTNEINMLKTKIRTLESEKVELESRVKDNVLTDIAPEIQQQVKKYVDEMMLGKLLQSGKITKNKRTWMGRTYEDIRKAGFNPESPEGKTLVQEGDELVAVDAPKKDKQTDSE